jgi:bifunctional DNA-binding transcriptional regulator/antitoxin component of YhaV-PrlF toxin-antitoxin module
MAVLTVDRRGRSTLPEEVRRELGIGDADQTLVLLERTNHGTWELIPAARDQVWFRHPEMASRVAEGERDLREGRSSGASTPEALHTLLDGMKRD